VWKKYYIKRQILVFGCQCVAKYIEGWQSTYNSCLVRLAKSSSWCSPVFWKCLSGRWPMSIQKQKSLQKHRNVVMFPLQLDDCKHFKRNKCTTIMSLSVNVQSPIWRSGKRGFPQIQWCPLGRTLSVTGKGSSVWKGDWPRWSVACLQMFSSTISLHRWYFFKELISP
jgi:hypothetical protein